MRHSTATIRFARELHARGYTFSGISRALERQGIRVARSTITRWVDPEAAVRYDEIRHQRRLRERALTNRRARKEYLLPRAQALVDAGLSYAATSRALEVYEGFTLAPDTFRRSLRGKGHRHAPGLVGLRTDNSANLGVAV